MPEQLVVAERAQVRPQGRGRVIVASPDRAAVMAARRWSPGAWPGPEAGQGATRSRAGLLASGVLGAGTGQRDLTGRGGTAGYVTSLGPVPPGGGQRGRAGQRGGTGCVAGAHSLRSARTGRARPGGILARCGILPLPRCPAGGQGRAGAAALSRVLVRTVRGSRRGRQAGDVTGRLFVTGQAHPEPHGLGDPGVGHPPGRGQRRRQQQPPAAFRRGPGRPGDVGQRPGRMTVANRDLQLAGGQPAGDIERGPRVHHRVGDQFAGEEHGVVDQPVRVPGPGGDVPRLEGPADETASCRGSRRLGLVGRRRDEVASSPHVF